jgi:hypothetical protein
MLKQNQQVTIHQGLGATPLVKSTDLHKLSGHLLQQQQALHHVLQQKGVNPDTATPQQVAAAIHSLPAASAAQVKQTLASGTAPFHPYPDTPTSALPTPTLSSLAALSPHHPAVVAAQNNILPGHPSLAGKAPTHPDVVAAHQAQALMNPNLHNLPSHHPDVVAARQALEHPSVQKPSFPTEVHPVVPAHHLPPGSTPQSLAPSTGHTIPTHPVTEVKEAPKPPKTAVGKVLGTLQQGLKKAAATGSAVGTAFTGALREGASVCDYTQFLPCEEIKPPRLISILRRIRKQAAKLSSEHGQAKVDETKERQRQILEMNKEQKQAHASKESGAQATALAKKQKAQSAVDSAVKRHQEMVMAQDQAGDSSNFAKRERNIAKSQEKLNLAHAALS